ncbi:MAG: hypothetical protein M3406_03360 [Chloroflexota bacterium]|nr:hypothetical protein [Chloroflexota bacterium]
MGEEPLVETRLAISAKRTELERTADQLREALDFKKRFQENPALFIGLGAGAVFLVIGGPVRAAQFARRRLFRSDPEKAYDALPKPMQSWVDSMAGTIGPRAAEARQSLSEELLRWRHDPKRNAKISKKMAEELAKGPAGPKRSAWTAFEAGAAILSAALARKAVERFLSGEPPTGIAPLDAVGTVGGAAKPDPKHAKNDVTKSAQQRAQAAVAEKTDEYSGMSARDR